MPIDISKIKKGSENIRKETGEKLSFYILSGMSFVVALSWNETIKSFIELLFPLNKNSIFAKFFYSFVITLLLIFVTLLLSKLKSKKKE